MELCYFRDRERREVDFIFLQDRSPALFVECKLSDQEVDPSLRYLKSKFPEVPAVQVSLDEGEDRVDLTGLRRYDAVTFLRDLGRSAEATPRGSGEV